LLVARRGTSFCYDQNRRIELMAFQLMSSAFAEGGWIPALHTCQGADISPSLEWSDVPAEARSLTLFLEDPDAPAGVWCHWLLYDIGVKTHALPQGFKPSSLGLSGMNDFDKPGYGGPCPPKGHGPHRYFFKLYALNVHTLGLPAGVKRSELLQALKGHIVGEAQYMGRFERK
jgi:Raf kinase inhibitor-like YbhB/YbcL family protein